MLISEPSNRCARYTYWELHYSRFWLGYRDWKAFTFSPWLPKQIRWQWIYAVFRWVAAAYFFGWLIPSGLYEDNGGPKYFIFLTNWGFLTWNSYLIISAISVTVKMCLLYCRSDRQTSILTLLESPKPYIDVDKPIGCCGRDSDKTFWYQKLQWLFFYIGAEMALIVSLLYWLVIYDGGAVDGVNANTHLINGIVALIDIVFSGVPVRVLHFIYPTLFGATYVVFTGIYHASDGTNVQGDPFIYSVINYEENPGSSTGVVLAVVLLFVPLVHLLVFGLYSARFWLTYCLWARRESSLPDERGTIMNDPIHGV